MCVYVYVMCVYIYMSFFLSFLEVVEVEGVGACLVFCLRGGGGGRYIE